jgi:hypothetical protein
MYAKLWSNFWRARCGKSARRVLWGLRRQMGVLSTRSLGLVTPSNSIISRILLSIEHWGTYF